MTIIESKQQSLSGSVSCSGIGLHSARTVDMTLRPAPENTGIVFRRVDLSGVDTAIPALAQNVGNTTLNTEIINNDGVSVSTIEHLMAAFQGLEIDNAYVDVNAGELPALDGSSAPFCKMIKEAGIQPQQAARRYLKVRSSLRAESKNSWAEITPSSGLEIIASIEFDDPIVGHSEYSYTHSNESFEEELARARTFCLYKDVTTYRAGGFALGGSLENAVVIDNGKILNEGGLHFSDEFVRHKTLDCLGDIYLGGFQVLGKFTFMRPGHTINNEIMKTLLSDPNAYTIADGETIARSYGSDSIPHEDSIKSSDVAAYA